ncbi:hypothetical protein GCM10022297_06060 [Lactobacillus hamsteri]|uniref:Uncharacterized protein n=1 Tax=Lactobacillus hamsteri DSM 5661 = JCM 6256 TaxID=1423754 RepID=A0A0R1YD39_9LACO|nr:hypothetical protein [Lactobacillus hamsteri]KRM37803.1 hypothetical protein FC39_GL001716 [Lactobacillus hamsteri DSM 5661 = JCM 6256]
MKLTKMKILTIVYGLLTLSGLAMLFSGLIIQMNEASDFNTTSQALSANGSTLAMIFAGVIAALGFGMAFFTEWARVNNKHIKRVKFA